MKFIFDKLPHILFSALLLALVGGIGYAWYHAYYVIDEQEKICDVAGKPVILQKFDRYKPATYWFEREGRRLQPSQTVEQTLVTPGKYPTMNYYFDKNGEQFLVTWHDTHLTRSWVISGVGSGWAGVEGFTFETTRKLGSYSLSWSGSGVSGEAAQGEHVFYTVGRALIKARSTEPGPNNVYVLVPELAKGKFGPYADVTMPKWVEGKPVYVGRKSKVEERGAERITTNAYVFSWNGQDMPVDCQAVGAPQKSAVEEVRRCGADAGADADCDTAPKPPVDEATYVKVVEPFDAPLCGADAKIGLERRVVKRVVAGQEQTSETLVYTVNGQRYPVGAQVHVAPKSNVEARL